MSSPAYVLVTPVRDEAATIEITIQSVLDQTIRPLEWVIVSDGSTDGTDSIVLSYENIHPFIRLLRMEHGGERSFSSVVHATRAGLRALMSRNYEYIGLLDADLRFDPDYFANLIGRFETDANLGMAGGLVIDVIDGKLRPSRQYLKDVAGATQFFRKECFEAIMPLLAIPEGGWDAITCYQARAKGYRCASFPDMIVHHLKPRNISEGNILRRNWQLGVRDYACGYHPWFELLKCGARLQETPPVIGALMRFIAFVWCNATRRPRTLPAEVVKMVRNDQMKRVSIDALCALRRRQREREYV